MQVNPAAYFEVNMTGESTTHKLQAVGQTLVLFGGSNLDTTLELRAIESNFSGQLWWRSINAFSGLPNAWNKGATARTSNGEHPEALDVSSATTMLLVQVGAAAGLTTGSTPAAGLGRVWYAVREGGWLVARERLMLTPSSGNVVRTIGVPFPCARLSGLMFAAHFHGVSGTIVAPTPMYRLFRTGDARTPTAWSAGTSGSNVTAETYTNSGNVSVATAGYLMAQAGLQVSTSGTDPYSIVDTIVAAKV